MDGLIESFNEAFESSADQSSLSQLPEEIFVRIL